ncbi:MAG: DUF924 family protein [Alphaproteobacteria bacterium]
MHQDIIKFWFEELAPKQHFVKDPELDAAITFRFGETYWQVLKDETAHWRDSAEGRLAEILVLDQFARNIFRNDPQAFAGDYLALALAQEAIRCGDDMKLSEHMRSFVYMPFMHSESKVVHETALRLFEGMGNNFDYEVKHKEIIDRFGRSPHRNAVLGRESTAEELEFLKTNRGF